MPGLNIEARSSGRGSPAAYSRNKAGPSSLSSSRHQLYVIRTPPPTGPQHQAAGPSNTRGDAEDFAKPGLYAPSEDDQATTLRRFLKPPPIEGQEEWGIPPQPEGPCDSTLEAKVLQFHRLKREQSRHFNDSLMKSKAFRNPHIYAKLVEFVDINETSTNFPKDIWDPFDLRDEWYAARIAERQKERSEKLTDSQAAGKRTAIAFESKGKASTSMFGSSTDKVPSSSSSSLRKKTEDVTTAHREARYHPYEKEKDRHRDRDREQQRHKYRDGRR